MTDLLIYEALRIAKEIHKGISKFETLRLLQEKIEKEVSPYKTDEVRLKFLDTLSIKTFSLFKEHLKTCSDYKTCPKHKTFRNFEFLIKQEKNLIFLPKNLSFFLEYNPELDSLIETFHAKQEKTATFIDKEDFINAEINRIREIFLNPVVLVDFKKSGVKFYINYTEYRKKAYDWLAAGYDFSISQIIKAEESVFLQEKEFADHQSTFKEGVIDNLRSGVAYVLYEKFLRDQLKPLGQTKVKFSTKKKRQTIPNKIRALLQKEIHSSCPFCPSEDVDHFEIHHIDEDPKNNSFDNLLMLCRMCHSKITKGDILFEIVVEKKISLKR